jgi:hypothetical protein
VSVVLPWHTSHAPALRHDRQARADYLRPGPCWRTTPAVLARTTYSLSLLARMGAEQEGGLTLLGLGQRAGNVK